MPGAMGRSSARGARFGGRIAGSSAPSWWYQRVPVGRESVVGKRVVVGRCASSRSRWPMMALERALEHRRVAVGAFEALRSRTVVDRLEMLRIRDRVGQR